MAFRLQFNQLLIVALTHYSQIFTLLSHPLELALQTGYLGFIDCGIVGPDSIRVQVCHDVNEVFLLNWMANLTRHVTHFDIKCPREQTNLLVQLLHLDVHFLKYLFLGIFIDNKCIDLLSLSLYDLLQRLGFQIVLISRLDRGAY